MKITWQPPTLETPRLRLRPLQPCDAKDVFLYACNPRMTPYTLWETHERLADSLWFVRDYAHSRYSNREPDPLAITLKSDPLAQVIGTMGVFMVAQPHATMELGYSIAEPYWGQGLATEAGAALRDWVFQNDTLHRLQGRILAGNDGSERVLQKLGFQREGLLRAALHRRGIAHDVVMYSLLRPEWERRTT